MDQARDGRQFLGVQATAVAVVAAMTIAVVAMTTTATQAVAPTTAPAMAAGGNAPTGYFPAQFADVDAEVTPHIEAF